MTGARHGRILRGRKKEHAVGTEVSLEEARQESPSRPAPGVPSRGGFLGSRDRAAPKVTERPSLHLKCSRTDNLQRRVHIHGAVTNSHYSRALPAPVSAPPLQPVPRIFRLGWLRLSLRCAFPACGVAVPASALHPDALRRSGGGGRRSRGWGGGAAAV
ncbi:hypothetical protein J1605_007106 [Eschrichtius robustus]|uniref:Uncharacterized protein n=1 Tax=Eschrichtius robustus TaxID=9764 RepID=A0AB34H471_ESCRO|nr:hypothetical protein J1605_007106 [Eschrichtius robustus]